jgi:hypothetical protein
MRHLSLMLGGIFLFVATAAAEKPSGIQAYAWLAGEWRGIGDGKPGHSAAERRIDVVLEGRYLRVVGRSVYPKQDDNPNGEIHEEIDIWSFDKDRDALVLRQFDNLGFVTTYVWDRKASGERKVVLNAEQLENVPAGWRARYTLTFMPPDEYHEMLELATDGQALRPYVKSRFLRLK